MKNHCLSFIRTEWHLRIYIRIIFLEEKLPLMHLQKKMLRDHNAISENCAKRSVLNGNIGKLTLSRLREGRGMHSALRFSIVEKTVHIRKQKQVKISKNIPELAMSGTSSQRQYSTSFINRFIHLRLHTTCSIPFKRPFMSVLYPIRWCY